MSKFGSFISKNKFNIVSWTVTLAVTVGIALGGYAWRQSQTVVQAAVPIPTAVPDAKQPDVQLPVLSRNETFRSVERNIFLKTNIPADKPRYSLEEYRVAHGDSVFAIAKVFDLKPETVLWANYDILQDDPHSIKPGQTLKIPPTDGIYYQWRANDTLESVAKEFKANVDDILNYPGNSVDLSNPTVESGTWVMIPGGSREFVQWLEPTVARGASGTSSTSQSSCPGGGAIGSGAFVWPADNHSISGNDYWSGHLGIDISAGEGAPVYAADSGVVTVAGWSDRGYGNMIQIDHGNGYSTLYAHLSVIGVGVCTSVGAGQWIGAAGNTGNSQGAHLHFEVRLNGGFINPHFVLP